LCAARHLITDRDAAALDERLELDLPALGEVAQHGGQRVEPVIDGGAAKSSPETPT
jgi:hypothetical protein